MTRKTTPKVRNQLRRKRPYTTHYFDTEYGVAAHWATQGHSASEKGAIRGAVVRVFMAEHKYALIYEGQELIFTVHIGNKGLAVDYGRT